MPDLGHSQPLKDGTRCRRDPHEVDTARVVPLVEPEVAAAVGPCRRRVAPRKRREGHHDGTERVPRGVRNDVGDAHDRALVHQDSRGVLVDREHWQYPSTFKCRVAATAGALVVQHERRRVDPSGIAGVRDFQVGRLARRPVEQDAVVDHGDLGVLIALAEVDRRNPCDLRLERCWPGSAVHRCRGQEGQARPDRCQ